jgi:sporulation protein YlmC with PRC-barrel domain
MEVVVMKRSIVTLLVLFTFVIFASGTSFSADQAKDKPGYGQDRKSGAMIGKDNQSGAMMGQQQGELSFNQPQRLSEIIDSDVINHQGEELGTVNDLVVNEKGQLEYLILSRGGVMGIGASLIAIPLDAVSVQITDEKKLSINVDETTLDQATSFAAGDFPDFSDRQWQKESRGYFQNGATSPGVKERETSPGLQQEQTPRGGAQDGAMTPKEGTRKDGTTSKGSDAR